MVSTPPPPSEPAIKCEILLGRKYLEWVMRQHIPKEEKQYSIIPVHLFSREDKQCSKVQMRFLDQPLGCVFN